MTYLVILFLAFVQNASFAVVSRARNRNNVTYHLVAAGVSNTLWFLTTRQLVLSDMSLLLFIPYTIGTVAGSLSGAWISMRIERALHATSDDHLEERRA